MPTIVNGIEGAVVASLDIQEHLRLFNGNVWYADAAMADDTQDGQTPNEAKKTIGAAITAAAGGDAVSSLASDRINIGVERWQAHQQYWNIGLSR